MTAEAILLDLGYTHEEIGQRLVHPDRPHKQGSGVTLGETLRERVRERMVDAHEGYPQIPPRSFLISKKGIICTHGRV